MTTTPIQREALPPRTEVCREAPFRLRDAGDGEAGDGLTLDGYAAVFNRETIIDSWEGRFREQIAPGAMKRSFRESPPRIQFDHGRHNLIGSIPIASLEQGYPREEVDPDLAPEGGAHVLARLHDNWLVQPVRDAIASGTVDGMSFRFSVVREQWHDHTGKRITDDAALREILRRSWLEDVPDDELPLRTLQELRVPELGPVVWPAYSDTSVGVRSSVVIDLSRLDDPVERTKLARAVLIADRAEEEAPAQPDTPADDAGAVEHPEAADDTQRGTSPDRDAAKHLSRVNPHDVRAELKRVRDNNATIRPLEGK